ncbi:MAG TPA: ABC transporter permease [Pyrinomonadaceae bacterium]
MRVRSLRAALARLAGLAGRDECDRELAEELETHLQFQTEENLRAGMSPQEARRRALVKLGGAAQAREECRRRRGLPVLEDLWQDIRYGARMLMKKPGFTFVAVLTLGLGVGANTAIFSVVNALVLRPLPYAEPDRLVMVSAGGREASPADFFDWQAQSRTLDDLSALSYWNANLGGVEAPERIQGFLVTAGLFPMLGVRPMMGRTFTPEEMRKENDGVVVLSYEVWRRVLGSDRSVLGKTLTINARQRTVVGVMPPGFQFYDKAEAWAPLALDPHDASVGARRAHYLIAAARLKPGVTIQQAQAEMNAINRRLGEQYPETDANRPVKLVSVHEYLVGPVRPALLALVGMVGFVLLIACANVANLLLARNAARQREFALRVALGAGRLRIVRQLLTESALLAVTGGGLGLLVALWGVELLVARIPPGWVSGIPLSEGVRVDARVLTFTLVVSLVTGLVFGLAPALQVSQPDLNGVLKEGGRAGGAGGRRQRRLRGLLVVAEVALSLTLLIGAGLMVRSFVELMRVPSGFNAANVLTMKLALPGLKYTKDEQVAGFYAQALESIAAVPGVEAVGATTTLPLGGGDQTTEVLVAGRPAPAAGQRPEVSFRDISPDYFRALGIPLLRGRTFTERDDGGSPGVAVLNETMARRLFGAPEAALGQRLTDADGKNEREVVGLVGDVRHAGLDAEPKAEMYVPFTQEASNSMTLVVRTASDPASFAPAMRARLLAIDKDEPAYDVRTMERVVAESVSQRRLTMLLFGLFAALALALATIGIYGVMSYTVSQRAHEIGVRVALGAQRRDVLRLVIADGMALTLGGVVLGLAAAFALTRLLASLLYGVKATDPATYAAISLLLATVALLACYLPARRATKMDPLTTLRAE